MVVIVGTARIRQPEKDFCEGPAVVGNFNLAALAVVAVVFRTPAGGKLQKGSSRGNPIQRNGRAGDVGFIPSVFFRIRMSLIIPFVGIRNEHGS